MTTTDDTTRHPDPDRHDARSPRDEHHEPDCHRFDEHHFGRHGFPAHDAEHQSAHEGHHRHHTPFGPFGEWGRAPWQRRGFGGFAAEHGRHHEAAFERGFAAGWEAAQRAADIASRPESAA